MNNIMEHEILISEKFPVYELSNLKGITFFLIIKKYGMLLADFLG